MAIMSVLGSKPTTASFAQMSASSFKEDSHQVSHKVHFSGVSDHGLTYSTSLFGRVNSCVIPEPRLRMACGTTDCQMHSD